MAATILLAAVPASGLTLRWQDNASNEDAFVVERCQGVGCDTFIVLATLPPNTVTYVDATSVVEVPYCYRVYAVNAFGPSGYSNTVCVTQPSAPYNLTVQ